MLTSFEVTFLGTPVDSRHGDEEKQGAHTKKSEAGPSMRKQKEKSCSLENDQESATSSKPGELFHDPFRVYHPLIHAEIKCYLVCLTHFLNVAPPNFI